MPNLSLFNQSKEIIDFNIDLAGMKDIIEELREAEEECGGNVYYKAKVATGGGKSFEILTGNDDNDVSVPSITGVIIHNHKCNAYFEEDSTGNSPPICSSVDGKYGLDVSTGEHKSCDKCPLNEYGSSSKGKGKACKNMHRLYILTEGCPFPITLSLPPTSLRAWQNYRLSVLASSKLKPHEVVTEFTLAAETNSMGIKYSVVKFKLCGKLDDKNKIIAVSFTQDITKIQPELTGDDYNRLENGKPEDVNYEEQI